MGKTIEKKILPQFFEDVLFHNKRFEIRKDEDDARPGDVLVLLEWDEARQVYTGRSAACSVLYVFRADEHGRDYGLKPGYCIIGFARWN